MELGWDTPLGGKGYVLPHQRLLPGYYWHLSQGYVQRFSAFSYSGSQNGFGKQKVSHTVQFKALQLQCVNEYLAICRFVPAAELWLPWLPVRGLQTVETLTHLARCVGLYGVNEYSFLSCKNEGIIKPVTVFSFSFQNGASISKIGGRACSALERPRNQCI